MLLTLFKKTNDIDPPVYCAEGSADKSKVYFHLEDRDTLLKLDILFIRNETDNKLLENIEIDGVILYERQ